MRSSICFSTTKMFALCSFCFVLAMLFVSLDSAQAADISRPALQVADVFEPNDTVQSAKFLPQSGTNVLTFFTNNPPTSTASAADDDWFLFILEPNRSIVITATSLAGAGSGSLIIEGFSDANGTVAVGSTNGQGNMSAVKIVNGNGMQRSYRIRVRNLFGTSAPSYGYRIDYILKNLDSAEMPDAKELNDLPATALGGQTSFLNTGTSLSALNFYASAVGIREHGDVDWYFFYAKRSSHLGGTGGCYRVTTSVQPGVDTEIFIYRGDQVPADNAFTTVGLLASNDDVAVGRRESQVSFSVPFDGIFWIKVWNLDPTPRGAGQTYTLALSEIPLLAMRSQTQASDPCGNLKSTYLPIQARNSATTIQPTPTVVITNTQPLQPGSQLLAGTIRVVNVFANGNIALNEADEYVELRNEGQTPAYLDGWRLKAIRNVDNAQLDEYIFTGGAVIAANQTCRIYTNLPFGTDNCGFAGGFANDQPIWPQNGARAALLNPQGQEMARFVY